MEGNETGMDFEVSIDEGAEAYSVIAVRGEVDLHTAPNGQQRQPAPSSWT